MKKKVKAKPKKKTKSSSKKPQVVKKAENPGAKFKMTAKYNPNLKGAGLTLTRAEWEKQFGYKVGYVIGASFEEM